MAVTHYEKKAASFRKPPIIFVIWEKEDKSLPGGEIMQEASSIFSALAV